MVSRIIFKPILQLLILFVLTTFESSSQVADFYLQGNLVTGFSSSKSLNSIVDLYNETNVNYIAKEMNHPKFALGYDLQFDTKIGNLFTAVGFTAVKSSASSRFPNDTERQLNMRTKYFSAYIGYASGGENELAIYSGINMNSTFVNSYIQYPNGDKDHVYGQLGGTYKSVGIGVPIVAHYAKSFGNNFQLLFKMQMFVLRATKFTYVNNTRITGVSSSSLLYQGTEAIDDNRSFLLSVGLRYKL